MTIKNLLWGLIPAKNSALLYFCNRYVDRYNNNNNSDSVTNGELSLLRSVLPDCKTVFDVGANVGNWAALARGIKPGLNMHCFEPSIATFKQLEARYSGQGIVCNNFGLSSAQGELPLHVYSDGSGLNSMYVRRGLEDGWRLQAQSKVETVKVDTLDAYCQRAGVTEIDFLKVDVEGHELEVFKGATEMLSKNKIKCIQFEYGGCNIDSRVLLKDIFDFFSQYECSFHKIYPECLLPVLRYDQRLENFQYQNWVLIQKQFKI